MTTDSRPGRHGASSVSPSGGGARGAAPWRLLGSRPRNFSGAPARGPPKALPGQGAKPILSPLLPRAGDPPWPNPRRVPTRRSASPRTTGSGLRSGPADRGIRRRARDRVASRGGPPGAAPRAHRVGELREPPGTGGARVGTHEQVRGRLLRAPLLRRVRVRRRRGVARGGAREAALLGGLRQRPAPLRLPGERGGVPRPRQTRRHHPRHEPRRGRAPHPRLAGQLLRADLPGGAVRARPRVGGDRLRPGRGARPRAPAPDHRRGLLRVLAGGRLGEVSRHRGRDAGVLRRRRGARRGPHRGRPLPEPRAARRRDHHHHPQDPAGAAGGAHPRPRQPRDREAALVDRVPRDAGGASHARHRGEGGGAQGGDGPGLRGLPAGDRRECPGDGDHHRGAKLSHRVRWHRQPPDAHRSSPARRPLRARRRSRSRARPHHRQQEHGAERSPFAVRDERPADRDAGHDHARDGGLRGGRGRSTDLRRARPCRTTRR